MPPRKRTEVSSLLTVGTEIAVMVITIATTTSSSIAEKPVVAWNTCGPRVLAGFLDIVLRLLRIVVWKAGIQIVTKGRGGL